VYDYDCYRQDPRVIVGATPNAERAAREVLSLPVHQHLTDDDVATVVRAVRDAFGR
jgi:perosamine synthetase